MRLSGLFITLLSVSAALVSVPRPKHDIRALNLLDEIAGTRTRAVQARFSKNKRQVAGGDASTCTLETARRRKDWEKMTSAERINYSTAVKCLLQLPSNYNHTAFPGARTRFDDYVAFHVNITPIHHGSFSFLSFHRAFLWAYETELIDKCNYTGAQPYWNWFTHIDDLTKHPVFDGSATSMSGDGAFFAHNGSSGGNPAAPLFMPSGKGGGCVTSGPFVNMTVNIGPLSAGMDGQKDSPADGYNPRCICRDLTSYATKTWMTYENLYNVTFGAASADIGLFQDELQGRGFPDGFMGLHATGHYAMGCNAADLWSSNNDPAFYLHHAMMDRLWLDWQTLHPEIADTVAGTMTINNMPPTRDGTVNDPIHLEDLHVELLAPLVKDLMDPMAGTPLCYVYE